MTRMVEAPDKLRLDLEEVSRALQAVHKLILEAEGPYIPGQGRLALLDRLINDPAWVWLRALSMLIADLDEALAKKHAVTQGEAAAAAGHVRALVFGLGAPMVALVGTNIGAGQRARALVRQTLAVREDQVAQALRIRPCRDRRRSGRCRALPPATCC